MSNGPYLRVGNRTSLRRSWIKFRVRTLLVFPTLNSLGVSGDNITNIWLHEMSSLKLEIIIIGGGNVTDDALESLAAMKSLKRVDFHGTQVTQAEASRVQRMMSGCTIRVN